MRRPIRARFLHQPSRQLHPDIGLGMNPEIQKMNIPTALNWRIPEIKLGNYGARPGNQVTPGGTGSDIIQATAIAAVFES